MKFSESWLREWVNPDITTEQLVAQLTMAGLEVDAVQPAAGAFSGVVVAEILAADPHPDAEKLRVCRVQAGEGEPLQIVCGAANARPGIKVPLATVGARLPGDFAIKKAKLRGVESHGMLCAQTELHVGDDDSGLWELPADAPVGTDLRQYLKLDDAIIEVDLTPNRGDCLSIRGIAREVAAINRSPLTAPVQDAASVSPSLTSHRIPVIDPAAASACPVYVGREIRGIRSGQSSPLWLVEKLRRSGIRSIDPVVDVTNFVLLELGQPMHAFDGDKLSGNIQVRYARSGETLALLNGQNATLTDNTLVIADDQGPLAMAGIMGGVASSVTAETRNLFLESAFFAPLALAGKARAYGLHTDSSHRFERGVDFALQVQALERATALLTSIVGGEVGPLLESRHPEHRPVRNDIVLRKQRLQTGLGLSEPQVDVEAILSGLGLQLLREDTESWAWRPPSYRFDLAIEEDLLEEVGRIYGYDRLPTRTLALSTQLAGKPEALSPTTQLKSHLVSRGYQEVITYSFIDPALHASLYGDQAAVLLRNPISAEMASMRTSLVPGLLQTLLYNLNRQQSRGRLFEVGMVFRPEETLQQTTRIAGLAYGPRHLVSWTDKARDSDFFDLKGDLESLLAISAAHRNITFTPGAEPSLLHPGQSAQVWIDGQLAGYIGALHPQKLQLLGLNKPVYVFECDLASVIEGRLPRFQGVSRYPEVSRDIAILVDRATWVADIDKAIRKAAGDVLKDVRLFDVYSGEGIDPQRKSLAFSLTFQHVSRTLKDDEITASMDAVVGALKEAFDARLR